MALATGTTVAVVLAAFYGLYDKTLTPLGWWRHYVGKAAVKARRRLCVAHAAVGLVSALFLSHITRWFPFGTDFGELILAGAAWAALGEALFRAEAAALDLGRVKPGVSLLRKALSSTFDDLQRAAEEEVDRRILQRAQNDLEGFLVEILGLEQPGGGFQNSATAGVWAARLHSNRPGEKEEARVAALNIIKRVVVDQLVRLDP